jgi:ribonuclease R
MLGGVQRVLERAHTTIVGTVNYRDGLGVVHPADECIGHDIFIDSRAAGKSAQDGDVVVVRLTTYPSRLEAAQGYIEEVLGHHDEQGMDIAMVIRKHGLATVFSAAALEEAAALMAKAKAGDSGIGPETPELPRRDLRGRLIFTIDPVDARDFDDALSVDFIDGQMLLGVHIADVSAYVPWDSSLDLDARRRATSVYLPDRVLPMLPPQISDELCSLRPAEDKLAFTVDLLMRSDDTVASYDIYPSLIRSRLRLSYDEVQRFLDGDTPAALLSDSELQSRLLALNRLARKLARRREARGAIDFESTEAKLTLDEQGKPTSVYLRRKNAATALVEEAMILTNEVVAGHMLERKAPMVYRVHEEPFQAALDQLLPTLQEFDYADQGAPQTAFDIQHILALSRDHPEHALISQLLLRAMKRAKYAPVFSAHFGLAAKAYTHFTSPIRRYPDLLAHRLLKLQLLTKQAASAPSPSLAAMIAQLPWLCEHSSDMEREAEQASLEVTAVKLCEYLVPRVGEQFSGIISGINTYGFYVREDSTTAEGFVSRESLSESMHYEESRHRYSGVISDQVYRLGQHVQVILKDVDLSRAMLEFVVVK